MKRRAATPPPGRPGPGRDKQVRRLLLESARDLYARRGYQGVTVKAIAGEAGVNPAMVHYYFGSKEGLFTAVIGETLEPVLGNVDRLAQVADIGRFVEQFLKAYMRTLADNPWVPVMLAREVLLPEGRLREPFLRQVIAPVSGKIRELIKAGVARGDIDKTIDPRLATINLVSLAAFPFLARPVMERAFKLHFNATMVDKLSRHAARVYLDGLRGGLK